jgi:hypothetical protein
LHYAPQGVEGLLTADEFLFCFSKLALKRAYDEAIGDSSKLGDDHDHEVALDDRIVGSRHIFPVDAQVPCFAVDMR